MPQNVVNHWQRFRCSSRALRPDLARSRSSRQTTVDVAGAALNAARAHVATAERRITAAEAEVRRIRTRIEDILAHSSIPVLVLR